MSSKDASLYGVPRPKKRSAGKDLSSASTLAFTTQLSSLIAAKDRPSSGSGSTYTTTAGRPRPRDRTKDDIFTTHNKGARKRALKDLEDGETDNKRFMQQRHTTTTSKSDEPDAATWRRARRKMEDKARLYAAMKRGEVEDEDERLMVDFDRKWADQGEAGRDAASSSSEDGGRGSDDDEQEELVEYMDEFGRTRKGTRFEAAREELRRQRQARDAQDDRFTARPVAPGTLIYGDTIQAEAFRLEEDVATRMAELAAKRDREATPPPDEHFDTRKEVRTKGVGFFAFSADEETRAKEMDALERERQETVKKREERLRKKEERKKLLEERKRVVGDLRGKARAERFLDDLGSVLGSGSEPPPIQGERNHGAEDDQPSETLNS